MIKRDKVKKSASTEKSSIQALQLYLTEISKIPLLTASEEKELGFRIRAGDEQAVHTLVESNLRFVVRIAKRYRRFGVPFLDLINEGNIGLIQAARRFNPEKIVKFISYAVWWIRQSILTSLSNTCHPLRLPLKVNHLLYKIDRVAAQNNTLNEQIQIDEIAGQLNLSSRELVDVLRVGGEAVSLSQTRYEGEIPLERTISQHELPSVEDSLMQSAANQNLANAMSQLQETEQRVLALRFGFKHEGTLTLKEIGERIGVSRERVRQIQEKALEKLRQNQKTRYLAQYSVAG